MEPQVKEVKVEQNQEAQGGGGGGGGGEDRLDKCGPAGGGHALSHCLVTQTLIYVQQQQRKKLMEKYTSICRQNIFPLI